MGRHLLLFIVVLTVQLEPIQLKSSYAEENTSQEIPTWLSGSLPYQDCEMCAFRYAKHKWEGDLFLKWDSGCARNPERDIVIAQRLYGGSDVWAVLGRQRKGRKTSVAYMQSP